MLTRSLARTDLVAESDVDYNVDVEYEYRDAEYEYGHEKEPEPRNAPKDASRFSRSISTARPR